MKRKILICIAAGCLAAYVGSTATADSPPDQWLGFRGDGDSVSSQASPPVTWSVETGENVAWTADLAGRGVSGPIVAGGLVITTSSSGPQRDRLHVEAFDVQTGQPVWRRQFWATGRTLIHPMSAVAANTPVSDGETVFAFFSSNDLAAIDLDGNVRWIRGLQENYPAAGNDVGMSSSPTIAGDVVVVQSEAQGDAFAAAFDRQDGALRWRVERPRQSNWCSPIAIEQTIDGEKVDAVVLQSRDGFDVYRADDGRRLWGAKIGCSPIPSAVFADQLYVPSGGLSAYAVSEANGPIEAAWSESRLQPSNASPIVHDGRAYVINGAGVLSCAVVGAGEIAWRSRLGGTFWATPVIAGDHLYAVNSDGVVYVVELSEDEGKVVQEIALGEEIYASPAVAEDALFLRG
ncbi:MAG: PQQ-binding-like beta-propeller repeat protein, partial [Planctomycetota bacterium]